jgi:hypothetical protein
MTLSLMFLLGRAALRAPVDARACKHSAILTLAPKEVSAGKRMPRRRHVRRSCLHTAASALRSQGGSQTAYARKMEIEMRPRIHFEVT